jgi:hypothetical protein
MIINYKPVNLYKTLFIIFLKVLLLFTLSWGIFYLISTESRRYFLTNNIQYTLLFFIAFTSIALAQTWFNSKVYIYYFEIKGKELFLKWQEWNNFKEIKIALDSVKATLVPAGKNTPYLKIDIKVGEKKIVLKQTYYNTWSKEVMEKVINFIKAEQAVS